jgi:hypothetical protein
MAVIRVKLKVGIARHYVQRAQVDRSAQQQFLFLYRSFIENFIDFFNY